MKKLSLLFFMVISFTCADAQVKPTRDEAEEWLLKKLDRYIDHDFAPDLDIRINRSSNTLIIKNRAISEYNSGEPAVFVTHVVKIDEITHSTCQGGIGLYTEPNGIISTYTTWSNTVKDFYITKQERRKDIYYYFVSGHGEPNLSERVWKCIQDLQSEKKESY